ncbi:hypothetical protein QYE76_030669 [Lolium multiflorum]|uniref:Protein kinase domain-containing protein n=1 Tax=Lolium multiflorum TaxID=4521 RepID=A0AAD8VJ11_LOLMU|nr:hypothetical protein QYE76_030669 [Lolium multiflorum]
MDGLTAGAHQEPPATIPYPVAAFLLPRSKKAIGVTRHVGTWTCTTRSALDPAILSGCATFCSSGDAQAGKVPIASSDNGCYGMGCCQARIASSTVGMPDELSFTFADLNSVEDILPRPPYALIAKEGWFDNRLVSDQQTRALQGNSRFAPNVPIVLRWEVMQSAAGIHAASDVKSPPNCPAEVAADICKSKHSHCIPGDRGYSCQCRDGYSGNPYVPRGCKGGLMSFKGVFPAIIGIACGTVLVLAVLILFFASKKIKIRRAQMLKRKFFEQNHGQLLEQLVSQSAGIGERMIITLDELEKATCHFDKELVVGGGGHGTVYKGILSNQRIVAIKKPNKEVQKEIDEFINEVAILSQKRPRSLSWEDRLRIAIETSKSLAYLHSAASVPIIHRDVKSANILLDDTLTAKVADFGASRYIPMEKSGVATRAQGTRGYWDPMYFYTGRLTEKSDVYSFGVVLVELLTRKKPSSYLSSDDEALVVHFVTLFGEGNLPQILDPQVMEEGGKEVEDVATITVACLKLRGEDRPTMRHVELTLEGLRESDKHTSNNVVDNTVGDMDVEKYVLRRGGEEPTRRYSMEEEFILSARYPR